MLVYKVSDLQILLLDSSLLLAHLGPHQSLSGLSWLFSAHCLGRISISTLRSLYLRVK